MSLLLIALSLIFPPVILANSSPEVVINEIAWMGTKIENVESKNWWRYEWLELYNNTDQSISLEGWRVELSRTETDWTLNLKGLVGPESYYLIVSSDKISADYDLSYKNLGGKFNNAGQKIVLRNAEGSVIDSLDCHASAKWFAGNNSTKQTMERKNSLLSGSDANNWQTSQNSGGTPKAPNSLIAGEKIQQKTISKLQISSTENTNSKNQTEKNQQEQLDEKLPAQASSGLILDQEKTTPKKSFIWLIASGVAIFSGSIILYLKNLLGKDSEKTIH